MSNKKWSKLVQIGKNTEKAHTESTEIHRNSFAQRRTLLSFTEIHRNSFAQWETSFLTRKSQKI